jgi:hypothetical protein
VSAHASSIGEDGDGFLVPRCTCGWEGPPVPDDETATDVLMDHAFMAGWRACESETPQVMS